MTKDEQTTRHLRGKVSSLVGSPLATSQPSSYGKKPLSGQKIEKKITYQGDYSYFQAYGTPLERKGQFLLQENFGKAYPNRCFG